METFVRGFIRAALVWLGIGVLMGLAMSVWPQVALGWRPAHMHANLLGFVSMMIFGVAYHVLPRFFARPLHAPRLALAHLWVANVGLALMVVGFVLRLSYWTAGSAALVTGAVASAAGAFFFIYNGWRTTAPLPRPAAPPPSGVRRSPLPQA
jgi:hypothetical protein